MKPRMFTLFLFVAVAALELLGEIYGWRNLVLSVKPLLMPTLAAHFFFAVGRKDKLAFYMVMALLLSWLGDVLLMFVELNPRYFLLGLLAFLLAHVMYMIIFRRSSQGFKPRLITYATGFSLFLFGLLLLLLLWPGLGGMKFPVVVYTVVIITMGFTALFRQAPGASYVLVGAMLFIGSDALIAVNKFSEPVTAARFWIMLTYITAQFLLVTGMITYFTTTKR